MHDLSLLDEFLAESRDHLEQVERDFMAMQENPQQADSDSIHRIFRAVHTVKGSSGFFGLTRIGALAHAMESLLDLVRSGTQTMDRMRLDALLAGVDALNALLADVHNSNGMKTQEIERQIQKLASGDSKENTQANTPPAPLSLQGGKIALTPEIKSAVPAGHHLFQLSYNLQEMETNRSIGPVSLIEYLQKMGTVLDGVLESVDTGLYYHLLFATVLEREFLLGSIHAEDSAIVELQLKEPKYKSVNTGIAPIAIPKSETTKAGEVPKSEAFLKVRVDVLDRLMSLAGELVLVRNQQLMLADDFEGPARSTLQQLDVVTNELQESIMRTRMQPIGSVFSRFHRVAREIGQKLGKEIQVLISGSDVELDKNILEALVDPLTHMVRNSCDHGIEAPADRKALGKAAIGSIRLEAFHEGGQIHILVADDGHGIASDAVRHKALEKGLRTEEEIQAMSEQEVLNLVFLPGFSTAQKVTDMSGRGVGMDVVKTTIEKSGGVVELQSKEGEGSTFRLRLPLTMAIIPSMIVESNGQRLAIPQISLEELVGIYDQDIFDHIESADDNEVYRLRNSLLPLVELNAVLNNPEPFSETFRRELTEKHRQERAVAKLRYTNKLAQGITEKISSCIAVVKVGKFRYGLRVDRILGTEEIVVKAMHRSLKALPLFTGATVLGDGDIALILDVAGIARHAGLRLELPALNHQISEIESNLTEESLLIFRNGGSEQFALPMQSMRRIERIAMHSIQRIGNQEFYPIAGQLLHIVRIERILDVQKAPDSDEMFLLLPHNPTELYGILCQQIADVQSFRFQLDRHTLVAPGVRGVTQIDNHLTILIDADELSKQSPKASAHV